MKLNYSRERESAEVELCTNPIHQSVSFKKIDLTQLVYSQGIVKCITQYIWALQRSQIGCYEALLKEKGLIQSFIGQAIEIVLEFRDREMYDSLSYWFIEAEIFDPIIRMIISNPIEPS